MRKFILALAILSWCSLAYGQTNIIGGGVWGDVKRSAGVSGWCGLIPQSGLVNCWPYDTAHTTSGTATDVIGSKNSTQTNVTLNGSGPSTNLNNAIVCNGTSSRGDTALANLPTAAFSLVMWVNTSTTANGRIIANDHTDNDNNGFEVNVSTSNTVLYLGNGTTAVPTGTGGFSAATWTMITYTYDGTTVRAYVNATTGGTASFTGPVSAGTNNVSFCVNPSYNGDWYPGMIAGVAIFNRALSAGEVTTINGL
jgi:hypothetical protein